MPPARLVHLFGLLETPRCHGGGKTHTIETCPKHTQPPPIVLPWKFF
jgi:hypothetical protein